METSSGMRKMHTLRKLPITNPNTKMKAITKVGRSGPQYEMCHRLPPPSTQVLALSVRCLTRSAHDGSVSGQPVIRQDRCQARKSLPTSQVIGTESPCRNLDYFRVADHSPSDPVDT